MAACPQDLQDVTLASADPELILCWEKKVKQGKECSLLLEYKNGKVGNSETRIPAVAPKSQTEKKKQESGRKKKKIAKLLDHNKQLVEEKGLPPSNLMLKHAIQAPSNIPPTQKPGLVDDCLFKCAHCENKLKSKWKLGKHMRNKHSYLQKPEELRDIEANKTLNMSTSSEERSNTSLLMNKSFLNADTESGQVLDTKRNDQDL